MPTTNTHFKINKALDLSSQYGRAINLIQEGRRLLRGVTVTASVHLLDEIDDQNAPGGRLKSLNDPRCFGSIKEALGAESNDDALGFIQELLSADGYVNSIEVDAAMNQIENKTR